MLKVHHNTAKRAAAHGVQLDIDVNGETVVARANGRDLARSADPKDALNIAIRELLGNVEQAKAKGKTKGKKPAKAKKAKKARRVVSEDGDEDEDLEDEEADEDEEGRSVVKRRYRRKYKPMRYTCGDDLAQELANHLKVEGDDGKPRIDEDRLERFAKSNGCWVEDYNGLNVGMRRMNVANRLRAKVRKGHEIKWTR